MCYPGTELWIPALYGMEIPDPEGSGLMVPILGMEDENSGEATPLAGSMEDANGKGKRELGPSELCVGTSLGRKPYKAQEPWEGMVADASARTAEIAKAWGHRSLSP